MKVTETDKPARRSRRRRVAVAAAAVVGGLAVTTALLPINPLGAAPANDQAQSQPLSRTMPKATGTTVGMIPADFTGVIERVGPAVVNVQVTEKAKGTAQGGVEAMPKGMEEFFRRFFGENWPRMFNAPNGGQQQAPQQAPVEHGLGSGFIIDSAGYIVTNNHVAGDADKIKVTLQDGKSYPAKLIGKDAETDLALIKIDAGHPLPYVSFTTGPTPRPGTWVIAVGNPFGLDHTATAGIVSATGRAIGTGPYDDFLQIDAPINKGNSGGPLFNLQGQVVGVNTAIYSPSGGSVGIGFAIPAAIAKPIIAQLKEHGHVERGWLGVEIQQVTPEIAQSLGLEKAQGALVAKVLPNGPARSAGIEQGDVIISVNGKAVEKVGDLSRYIANLRPGHEAKLELQRNGSEKTVGVELGTRPPAKELASSKQNGNNGGGNGAMEESDSVLGMKLANVNDRTRQAFDIEKGVSGAVITAVDPESPAAGKGLSPGAVIVSVTNKPVHSVRDVEKRIRELKKQGRKAVMLRVHDDNGEHYVGVPIA